MLDSEQVVSDDALAREYEELLKRSRIAAELEHRRLHETVRIKMAAALAKRSDAPAKNRPKD